MHIAPEVRAGRIWTPLPGWVQISWYGHPKRYLGALIAGEFQGPIWLQVKVGNKCYQFKVLPQNNFEGLTLSTPEAVRVIEVGPKLHRLEGPLPKSV